MYTFALPLHEVTVTAVHLPWWYDWAGLACLFFCLACCYACILVVANDIEKDKAP
jgi:uncharacterized membrane protein YhdT